MKVLPYNQLDTARIPNFSKVKAQLERGDFRSADVKKLAGNLYRARLDRSNRLLFMFARHQAETYIVALEFIANHAYESSRFLNRGVKVDEAKLPAVPAEPPEDAPDLAYVNPDGRSFNVLDKVISFDDDQQEVFDLPSPLIVIGSAGSGKTVLTLEKMKEAEGKVLYVTRSPYLAENARELYYGMNYQNENQEVSFLSFAEFLDSIRVPATREMSFQEFAAWFARHRVASGIKDAHQFFEEVHGVITGAFVRKAAPAPSSSPNGAATHAWLTREEYLELGVRQSIYAAEERGKVYDLFVKYLDHLKTLGCHDINVLSCQYQQLAKPAWNFVVVDEVQDFTNAQLQLALSALAEPAHFILCGDSNQIVHPNFFSWAGLKRHFHGRAFAADRTAPKQAAESIEATDVMRILTTNYRSSRQVTEMANRILRLKKARFYSKDRESSYLVSSNSDNPGAVTLLPDDPQLVGQLDARTRASAHFAVIVMHSEDKAKARQKFGTPLIFSIQEAKGLEYENIILYDFVSSAQERFREICRDVPPEQVQAGELRYARSRDKSDKSLEIFKFHINALYVAATRAVAKVYLVESSPRQRLFDLLGVEAIKGNLDLESQQSSLADWQREARKLERQGKQEQAEAVRENILGIRKTPWQALDQESLSKLAEQSFNDGGKKKQLQLFEYALLARDERLLARLEEAGFRPAQRPREIGEKALISKHFMPYSLKRVEGVRGLVDKYGVDYRDAFGFTPLMLAARFGNAAAAKMLAEELPANPDLVNPASLNAFQIMLCEAAMEQRYAQRTVPALYPLLAPASLVLMVDGSLLKLDSSKAEFLLCNLMLAQLQTRLMPRVEPVAGAGFASESRTQQRQSSISRGAWPGFTSAELQESLLRLPSHAVPEFRTKRPYISQVLARNEVGRESPCNRRLFRRTRRGYYILNPQLRVRAQDAWRPVYNGADAAHLDSELSKPAPMPKPEPKAKPAPKPRTTYQLTLELRRK